MAPKESRNIDGFFFEFVFQVQELQEEEAQWVNYDEDELSVKMQLADSIFDALLKDTAETFTRIFEKRPAVVSGST